MSFLKGIEGAGEFDKQAASGYYAFDPLGRLRAVSPFLEKGLHAMADTDLTRRDFQRLSMAALGGALAGSQLGFAAEDKDKEEKNPLLSDPHVCRGINTCKGKGADKKNACAGQGTCATAKAHTCHAANDCKGQGGCGAKPGENACKGKGECGVPLSDGAWKKARKRFEELMKKAGKKFGDAPPKKK